MEKYYCNRCCQLYICKQLCSVCGSMAETKIHINVHCQGNKEKGAGPDD